MLILYQVLLQLFHVITTNLILIMAQWGKYILTSILQRKPMYKIDLKITFFPTGRKWQKQYSNSVSLLQFQSLWFNHCAILHLQLVVSFFLSFSFFHLMTCLGKLSTSLLPSYASIFIYLCNICSFLKINFQEYFYLILVNATVKSIHFLKCIDWSLCIV